MNAIIYDSPIGRLLLQENQGRLCGVRLLEKEDAPEGDASASPVLAETAKQLSAYFSGKRTAFDLPLSAGGTAFEQAVWRQLAMIPFGETRTYGQIAQQIGKPAAARAVGAACGRNPLLIVVPCHRVLGSSGRLTGFAAGLEAKRTLLALEGHALRGGRII